MKLSAKAGFFLFFISLFFYASPALAQWSAADSSLYKNAVQHLVTLYHQAAGDQSGLYNGSQYSGNPVFKEGHAYFNDDKPTYGSIVYDEVLYEPVLLQYDEIQEAIIMQDSSRRIKLIAERIAGFTIFDRVFVRIERDSLHKALIKTGFYNLLYNGKTALLKKEIKTIREDITNEKVYYYTDSHYYYYLRKENAYYPINSKKGLLQLLGDKKKDVQQFIRKNKLSYRKDRDNMLTKATAYYDQLMQ